MKLDDLRHLVDDMSKRPWPTSGFDAVVKIDRSGLSDRTALIALVNHADALLDLAAAVAQRLEAQCWSLGPQDPQRSKHCWCGDRDATDGCPITKADLAIYACYRELEAVE